MKLISIVCGKGGIGKTTSATNLGASLAKMGKRILILDIDKQGHASMQFNRFNVKETTISDVFLDKVKPYEAIQNTDISNVDIITANYELQEVSKKLELNNYIWGLKGILDLEYDFVIVDCPPDLGILTANSLVVSDYVLVPITCDRWGSEGFSNIVKKIDEVRDLYNSKLNLLGVFLIKDENSSLNRKVKEEYREVFGNLFFETTIRNSKLIGRSSFLLPVVAQYPNSKVTLDYNNLAKEVLNKFSFKDFSLVGGF